MEELAKLHSSLVHTLDLICGVLEITWEEMARSVEVKRPTKANVQANKAPTLDTIYSGCPNIIRHKDREFQQVVCAVKEGKISPDCSIDKPPFSFQQFIDSIDQKSIDMILPQVNTKKLYVWLTNHMQEIVGLFDHDLAIFVCGLIQLPHVSPRSMIEELEEFIGSKTMIFVAEIWMYLCNKHNVQLPLFIPQNRSKEEQSKNHSMSQVEAEMTASKWIRKRRGAKGDLELVEYSASNNSDNKEDASEQQDYKRRRQSYRAKNVHITKRSPIEIQRDIIKQGMTDYLGVIPESVVEPTLPPNHTIVDLPKSPMTARYLGLKRKGKSKN